MDEAGYMGSRLVVKSDQERGMVRLVEKVCEDRRGESVPMVGPQGHSASNGEVEPWIRRVKYQTRMIATYTSAQLGQTLNEEHPVWPWLL